MLNTNPSVELANPAVASPKSLVFLRNLKLKATASPELPVARPTSTATFALRKLGNGDITVAVNRLPECNFGYE